MDLRDLLQFVVQEAHAAWRFRWHALIVAWCVAIVGAVLVFSLPNRYASSAQVYADTDALTNPLLQGLAVEPNVASRLNVLTRTLLTRPNLASVADQTNLSLRATTPADKEALLAKLGATVQIKDGGAKNLYDISYSDVDPRMAQKVVQGFVQILMNDTLGQDSSSSASVQRFLQHQVDDYSNRLDVAEKKLADFRAAHAGMVLDGGDSGYAARLQAEESRLQSLQSQYSLVLASRAPTAAGGDPRIAEIDQQIATSQQQLDTLLLRYTDKYPDVITARQMIQRLKARRAELLKHPAPTGDAGQSPGNYANDALARGLSAQIAAEEARITALKQDAGKITQAQIDYQQLTRNYDTTKKQYDVLLARLNVSRMSQDAAQTGNNIKFRVVNPPIVPLQPSSPHRGWLLLGVFALAIGIGGAFGYFVHMIRPVFSSLRDLRQLGDYPVLGAFAQIVSPERRARRRRELLGFGAGVALLGVFLLLGFAFDAHLAHAVQDVFVVGPT